MKTKTNNKGGRPKKGDEDLKQIAHSVRFTPEEERQISKLVNAFGGTYSDFVRKAVLNAEVISRTPKDVIQLLSKYEMILRNTGTNLNTIVRNTSENEYDSRIVKIAAVESKTLLKIITEIKNGLVQS